jgi:hypothetical protein
VDAPDPAPDDGSEPPQPAISTADERVTTTALVRDKVM